MYSISRVNNVKKYMILIAQIAAMELIVNAAYLENTRDLRNVSLSQICVMTTRTVTATQ